MTRRIPDEEWLHLAKKTAVGTSRRVRHKAESRENMTVGNEPDRWWVRCNRCNAGAVVKKEHALTVTVAPPASTDMTLPGDMIPIELLPEYQQHFVAGFLASKDMDRMYLPADVRWSESRHRLMICDSGGDWMGRDTSGRSPQKWLTYNRQKFTVANQGRTHAILVEDTFSAYKVAYALRGLGEIDARNIGVICSLGTELHDSLLKYLLNVGYHQVMSFYDGDDPGYKGARNNTMRLNLFDIGSPVGAIHQCAPSGLDPKNMTIQQIRNHLISRRMV